MRYGRINWVLYTGAAAFAVAFGYLEAAANLYAGAAAPADAGGVQWAERAPGWLLATEQVRQVAGLIMLAAFALFSARGPAQQLGVFLYTLGVRCVIYYTFLSNTIGQPSGHETMGCLFFLPLRAHPPEGVVVFLAVMVAILGARLMLAPRYSGGNNERQAIHGARRRR